MVNAKLWGRQGDVVETTAVYTRDSDRFGNRYGEFAPEADGEDDVGTWERSALSARFFRVGKLKTKSSTYRHIFEEVHPFRTYGNDDGYLRMETAVAPRPPPNPPREAAEPSLTRNELCEVIASSQAVLESLLDTIRESNA